MNMTQLLDLIPATPVRNLRNLRSLVVGASAVTVLLTGATGTSSSPDTDTDAMAYSTTAYRTTAYSTAAVQYPGAAQNGGPLCDYLRTIENMERALRATTGDFAPQTAALDSAHSAMVAAALGKGYEPDAEEQARNAIRSANQAINAQGKTDEYTANLDRTGAFER